MTFLAGLMSGAFVVLATIVVVAGIYAWKDGRL